MNSCRLNEQADSPDGLDYKRGYPALVVSAVRRVIRRVRGFTLIEILASMAVLVILVLGLGRAFNDAASAFRRGTITVERNGAVQVAMEQIVRDLEGMVVNERLAAIQQANVLDQVTYGFGFDDLFFATTASDQDTGTSTPDPSAYHFVRYHVGEVINTNVGLPFKRFRLMRSTWKMNRFRVNERDPMGAAANREWWTNTISVGAESDTLLDNVIRFDVYIHDKNGNLPQLLTSSNQYWNSMRSVGAYESNTVPASIDIYVQATSEESMRQAGRVLLVDLTAGGQLKARSQMIRDSNMLTIRVFPFTAPAQWNHPAQFYY